MRVETIETLLVCVIVSVQLYVFTRTFIQISIFKKIIPSVSFLKISKVLIPIYHLERLTPTEILAEMPNYKVAINIPDSHIHVDDSENNGTQDSIEKNSGNERIEKSEVNIIEFDGKGNEVFDSILFSINNYLIRNRGGATDFNLIKDIVERNANTVEEDINISIAIPLYLGLMGTMIGIVIGLFNMPNLGLTVDVKAKDVMLNEGISLLIGGVKIAMIASFVGLLLTIFNSGWVFKGSRAMIEKRKNEFYTFVQVELLPIINQGLASTLESLQRNLMKFNHGFASNLGQLDGIFNSNIQAIKAQKELLDTIDRAKVSEMTRYNVKVLQQLDISVGQFEKFNTYLTNVNSFVDNSQQIVNRTNELLERTDNFQAIAETLDDRLNQSQHLLEFLSMHFRKLEEHKEFTSNAVADVGHSISETFKELKQHIQNSSEAVKNFTIDELETLKTALSEGRTNLGNLEHLATLKADVSQFKMSSASQGERLKQAVGDLNENMAKSIVVLQQIEQSNLQNRSRGFPFSMKRFFKISKAKH